MSWGVLPWVYHVWDSLGFLDLGGYFLPHFGEVFNYYLLKYFLMDFLSCLLFWDSYDSNVGAFNIVPEVSEVVLISFNAFFLFSLSASFISTILSYLLPQLFFCWFPPDIFLISVITLLIIDWLFLISSWSLLKNFLHLLISRLSVTLFCFQDFSSFYYNYSEFFFR